MSNQHRATSEHWAEQEHWASPPDADPYALCLLELRDRLVALEATVNNQQPMRAAKPASVSLVDRVANAIYSVPTDPKIEARAAIRKVAEWLRENDSECQMGGDAAATADLLDEVLNEEENCL